jgi:large subunit ribosomal protein L3
MSLKFIGKKKGMTQLYDSQGRVIACTVISAMPNVVLQKKNKEIDGYEAIVTGSIVTKKKSLSKPRQGILTKTKAEPLKVLAEFKVKDLNAYEIGQKIDASCFKVGDLVDVSGISKGKGYQGVMKLHGFAGGPAAHGSGFHRHAGSTGMRTTPGRCLPDGKRASQMGRERVTVQGLQVLAVDPQKNLIVIKGAVPGCFDSLVCISEAKKKIIKKAKKK